MGFSGEACYLLLYLSQKFTPINSVLKSHFENLASFSGHGMPKDSCKINALALMLLAIIYNVQIFSESI